MSGTRAFSASTSKGLIDLSIAQTTARLQWWARSFTGLRRIELMASPPTVTIGTSNTSTVNTSVVNGGSIPVRADSSLLTYSGLNGSPVFNGNHWLTPRGGTLTNGSFGGGNAWRVRFMTDAPAIDFAMGETQFTLINAIIDGKWATRSSGLIPSTANSGNVRYMKFDLGADAITYGLAEPTLGSAGTGYVVGDVLTLSGGTSTTAAQVKVAGASGGVISLLTIEKAGVYSVLPTGTISTTGGTGTGATISSANWTPYHSVRKMRQWEFIVNSPSGAFQFIGPVTANVDTMVAWKLNPRVPKLLVVGDSQNALTYGQYGGANAGVSMAERLGLRENLVINAMGGTGWITANGISGAFSHSSRVADYIAAAPDIIVFDGSQNDGNSGPNNAATTVAVTSVLNQLLAALPNVRIILIGPVWLSTSGYNTALAAGVAAASDQSRVRFVDNYTEGWSLNTNSYGATVPYATSDNAHLGQYTLDEVRSVIVAQRVAEKLLEMIP